MEYRTLGRTGLDLSRIVLGCGNFGGIGSDPRFFGMGEDQEEAFALMDHAWEMGVNTFDTADAYGGGRSETTIGRWLRTKEPGVRDQLRLSSKVGSPVSDDPDDRGLSARHINRQVDRSLKRLGVDRLAMYLIHQPDPETPIGETLSALDDVVRAGKVHAIGASNIDAQCLADALAFSERQGLARFEWVQNSYSLLERGQETEVLPLCAEKGLGFTPFSPLAGGWLTGKYRAPDNYPEGSRMTLRPEPYQHLVGEKVFRGLEAFGRHAAQRGVSLAALAMAWALSHAVTSAIVIGPRKPEHLVVARETLDIRLTTSQRDELASLFDG